MQNKHMPIHVRSRLLPIIITLCLPPLLFTGCGRPMQPAQVTPTAQPTLSVGLAFSTAGPGDRGFNDMAYAGLLRGQQELDISFHEVDIHELQGHANALRTLAEEEHALVIAQGKEYTAAVQTVAQEYPEQLFALLDAQVEAPNVVSVVFHEAEGDFLAGVLAALLSDSGTVAFLGESETPATRRIEHAWTQGVRTIRPHTTIVRAYLPASQEGDTAGKPQVAMEYATRLYRQGAEVVYAVTENKQTTLGAIEAAKQQQHFLITTGEDLRWLEPDVIVSSRVKQMDVAVFWLLQALHGGTLQPGTTTLDLQSGAIGLADMHSLLVPKEVQRIIWEMEQKLINGEIEIQT